MKRHPAERRPVQCDPGLRARSASHRGDGDGVATAADYPSFEHTVLVDVRAGGGGGLGAGERPNRIFKATVQIAKGAELVVAQANVGLHAPARRAIRSNVERNIVLADARAFSTFTVKRLEVISSDKDWA